MNDERFVDYYEDDEMDGYYVGESMEHVNDIQNYLSAVEENANMAYQIYYDHYYDRDIEGFSSMKIKGLFRQLSECVAVVDELRHELGAME